MSKKIQHSKTDCFSIPELEKNEDVISHNMDDDVNSLGNNNQGNENGR